MWLFVFLLKFLKQLTRMELIGCTTMQVALLITSVRPFTPGIKHFKTEKVLSDILFMNLSRITRRRRLAIRCCILIILVYRIIALFCYYFLKPTLLYLSRCFRQGPKLPTSIMLSESFSRQPSRPCWTLAKAPSTSGAKSS